MSVQVHRLPYGHAARADPWTLRGIITATLAAPLLYSLIVPLAVLDVWVWVYQAICGRILGIAPVRRRDYLVLDRQKLPYLDALQKLNCGYATGLIAFVREVAARTEQYWCPIRHAGRAPGRHPRQRRFAAYGDAEDYRARLPVLRRALAQNAAATRGRKE